MALQRAAYSTNIKTRLDFSCAIFDRSARLVAQSFSNPVHLGSMVHAVPQILEEFGRDRVVAGDGILCNDGQLGGLHLNDICVLAPVHRDGQLVAYVAAMAHHVDVGGGTPGSIGLFKEIYQEGLIIPPTRFMVDGRIDENVFRLVLNNVRAPRETGGDLRAQVAGVTIGSRRINELIDRYGIEPLDEAIEELLNYAERRVRAEIELLPRGEFSAEGFLDNDGFTDEPIKVKVAVTIAADGVVFDLTGSDEQRPCPVNTTYSMAYSACAYALRAIIPSDLPMNGGFYRVLTVIAPSGTVVNSRRPAAIGAGSETGARVCETAFRALAGTVPERLAADSKGCMCNIGFGGINPRDGAYFVFYEAQAGGYGARATKDGIDAIQPHMQNTENSPVEETEANYPVRIVRYALIQDSEGAGRFRGGLGLRRDYAPEGGVTFSVLADRAKFAPQGLLGGLPASKARFIRNPDTTPQSYPSKMSVSLAPGEVFSVEMAGGGGYGSPMERSEQSVLDDVLDEKVSLERAREVYGVVIDRASRSVDMKATALQRGRLQAIALKAAGRANK
ncbi:MAG: hydantoinase B/oxoprolinase family protein [Actinomycetota bacterium]|nr:hydantoinase B/oxoprolinase family protein [Actinomycetota bacterium]